MNDQLKLWIKENLLDSLGKISPKKLFQHPDKKVQIFELTNFLSDKAKLSQRCWHILNDVFYVVKCCVCNEKEVTYVNLREGYKRHCSQKCSMRNPNVVKKFNETMIDLYGSPWAMQSKDILQKSEESCLERYGVTHYTKTDTHINSVKERYRNESDEERETRLDKNRKTNLERYGVDWFSKTDSFKSVCKETWIENYGVEHPSQSPIILEKIKGGFKNSWHKYKLPSGKIINLQGYEPYVFDELLKTYSENEIIYRKSEIPEFWYIGIDMKKHRYFPDFYIEKDNLIIEVKSTFTYNKELDKNILKENCVKELGFEYKLWIWI